MILRVLLVQLILCSYYATSEKVRLDNYKVYRLFPKTDNQKEFLTKLEEEKQDLDFWTEVNPSNIPVDVMVSPKDRDEFLGSIIKNKINYKILVDDVQKVISNEKVERLARSQMTWTAYYPLEAIHSWLDSLPDKYPGKVEVLSAGSSFEGRDLKGVKLLSGPGKRAIFIEGGIHAREWISPATVTYIINEILTSTDPRFRKVADSFTWYIFPNVNPDGYVFTHNWYRLWRKTRTLHTLYCPGADPNRNWDFQWGEQGTSTNNCAETYGGPNVFSELETWYLAKFIESVSSNLDAYLAFHSYSQLLLIPYGNTTEHLDNYEDLYKIGIKATDALRQRHGTEYQVGNPGEIIYQCTGSSMDWVKDQFGVPITYTYELRDKGENGFLLPAEEIIPNSEEVVDSIVAMFEEAANLGYVKLK